jgi:hypothetical protein
MTIPKHYLHPKWRDMSEWVVHFTESQTTLASILAEGKAFSRSRTREETTSVGAPCNALARVRLV